MVDTQSQRRIFQQGYSYTPPRSALQSFRLYNSEYVHRTFKHYHPPAHECRLASFKDNNEPPHWPAYLLTFGWKQTVDSSQMLHYKDTEQRDPLAKDPEKLLFAVGKRGSETGQFEFPRSITISRDGDIGVADTGNHRIQIFNSAGVLKYIVGTRGKLFAQFDNPTGIATMPNGNYAVADSGNKRIQVLRPKAQVRYIYPTHGVPYVIHCDHRYNLFVVTFARQVEVYNGKGGKFLRKFPLLGNTKSPQVTMETTTQDELIICESSLGLIRVYGYAGEPLWEFEPRTLQDGLAMTPVGVALTPNGEVLIADALNHTVNVYNRVSGQLIQQTIVPTDELGSVQTLAMSPEGHIVVTEFSVNGLHCLKIFRYQECTCHRKSKVGYSTPIHE